MNTKRLYCTSLGRITLCLQAIWKKFERNTFWFWASIIFAFNVLPRLDFLINLNSDNLFITSWSGRDFFIRFFFVLIMCICAIPWKFNQFIRNSEPMTFVTMPANLWEKLTALMIYLLIMTAGASIVTYISVFIDYLLAPEVTSLGFSISSLDLIEAFTFSDVKFSEFMVFFLIGASALLTGIYTCISFKKFIVGIGLGIILWTLALILISSIIVNSSTLQDLQTNSGLFSLIFIVLALLVDLVLLLAIGRKLKVIED